MGPPYPGPIYNLGAVLFQLGETHEAVACHERSLELEDDADVRANLELVIGG